MRSRPKHLSFMAATLLLFLTSPLQRSGTPLGISGSVAAKPNQDSEAELEKLCIKNFQQFHGRQLQIIAGLGLLKKELSPAEFRKELEILQQALITQRKNNDGSPVPLGKNP
jgi:hypothetical protein